MGDFLRKNARTPHIGYFAGAGGIYRVATNCPEILTALGTTFSPVGNGSYAPVVGMRFWVDPETAAAPPWPRPYIRGWDNLIYASFAPGNFAIIDLHGRRISGRFTPEMASDIRHWSRVILPMMLSLMAGAMGIIELHCACLADGERGLLLSGQTRSGKSTLALALASLGLGFLSDDRILCWREGSKLRAWTALTDLKLRPEALRWFKHWGQSRTAGIEDHDNELRLEPESLSGITRPRHCRPAAIFFLEPSDSVQLELTEISRTEAEARLESGLLAESAQIAEQQSNLLSMLSRLSLYKVRYGADPWKVAHGILSCFRKRQAKPLNRRYLRLLVDSQLAPRTLRSRLEPQTASLKSRHNPDSRVDAVARFLPGEHHETLAIMDRTVTLESNSADIVRRLRRLTSIYSSSPGKPVSFHWRIIVQPDLVPDTLAFRRLTFSDPGIRFAQFGQRNFCAVDIRQRRALAFLTETMANDEVTLTTPFLDSLFCMCSASLGLLPLFSTCVGLQGKGILILGNPGNGKTTASYILSKCGIDLLADEGTFLEHDGQNLRAWGGFWPIAFRADASRFFPELETKAKPFAYHNFAYFHLDQGALHNPASSSVTPVACVFLERFASSKIRLSPIKAADRLRRLSESLLFEEDRRFRPQQLTVLEMLASLPGYRIEYGVDPADAAILIRRLLIRHAWDDQPLRPQGRLNASATPVNQG
ncbi:MAG: hypothetical protein JO356_01465 [Acidobacteria bacterium]|nr:hypothetical protein [Acidobacteriota bacterium]